MSIPMSDRKQQNAITKAITNLNRYAEKEPWSEGFTFFMAENMLEAATNLDIDPDILASTIIDSPYADMLHNYLFESFAATPWDEDGTSLFEDYVKRRGWREDPYARRYLSALAKSEIGLWEVLEVKKDQWIEVRPFLTKKGKTRFYERTATQNLNQWDVIATRLISLDGKYLISGGLLYFSPDIAMGIPAFIDEEKEMLRDLLTAARNDNEENDTCDWSDATIDKMVETEVHNDLDQLFLQYWIQHTYRTITQAPPKLRNRDGDEIAWVKVYFPMKRIDQASVTDALNAQSDLDWNPDNEEWVWIQGNKHTMTEAGVPLLGTLVIQKETLIAEVNSAERAEKIQNYMHELFREKIGSPLLVHENLDALDDDATPSQLLSPEDLEPGEYDAIIANAMTQHYQQILDEPVPMLNNHTPREAAQDEKTRPLLITWLKLMDNNQRKHGLSYETDWIWEELNIDRQKELA